MNENVTMFQNIYIERNGKTDPWTISLDCNNEKDQITTT